MPIIETGPFTRNYLVYDAPVNEKTKKIREMFKVDEETGYPEQYNWRGLAKLGTSYKPSLPYKVFHPYNEEEYYSTKVGYLALAGIFSAGIHLFLAFRTKRAIWSRPYIFLGTFAGVGYGMLWFLEKSLERQAIKQNAFIHYTEVHPERFGEIKRAKFREILFHYIPCR